MQPSYIPVSWAKRQAAFAIAAGSSMDELFERSLIAPKFDDERDVITPLQMALFQTVLVQETNDGSHAMMRHPQDIDIGPLGFRILFGSANLQDGLEAIASFYRKASRVIRLELSTEGSRAFLAIKASEDHVGGLVQEDIQLIYLHFGLTCFLQRPFPITSVVTRDPDHINLGTRHYSIGGRVTLGACAGFGFSRALLSSLPPYPVINDFLWRPVEDGLCLTGSPTEPCGASNETLRVANMAAASSVAPSTFRRHLARDGTSFRQIRESVLVKATLHQLATRPCCLDAIAADLGYADARSLRRFVKRTTGKTPSDIRSELRVGAPRQQILSRLREVLVQLPH